MAGKIIVSTLQSDTDNSISFVANTGATIFSANISHGIAGSFIANGSITGPKIGLTAINSNNIVDGAVTVSKGGTGLSTLTANSILIGNGTSSPQLIAPGTSANVLTSNGTNWISSALAGSPLVFIATSNVTSSVASVTFSNLDANTYISYMVSFEGLGASSGTGRVELNLGNNATIIASSPSLYYGVVATTKSDSTSYPILAIAQGDSTMYVTDPNFNMRSSDSLGQVSGVAWISNINNNAPPTIRAHTTSYNSNAGQFYSMFSNYTIPANGQIITQIRIRYASENLTKGRITVYGLKAS